MVAAGMIVRNRPFALAALIGLAMQLLPWCARIAAAQESVFLRAAVSESSVLAGERFTYQLEVTARGGGDPPAATLPDFAPFEVEDVQQSRSTRTMVVGSRVSQEIGITYQVQLRAPARSGEFTIPAARAGNAWSQAAVIRIADDTARLPAIVRDENIPFPFSRPDNAGINRTARGSLFLRAEASSNKVYKRQPIVLSYYLYMARDGSLDRLGLGGLDWGFDQRGSDNHDDFFYDAVYQAQRPHQGSNETLDGRTFSKLRLVTIIATPKKEGTLKLPPFLAKLTVSTGRGLSVFDPPAVLVPSRELQIEVMDTPLQDRPANYSGAVGTLTMSVSADHSTARQGEDLVTLTVTVRGSAYASLLPAPIVPSTEGFSLFQAPRQTSETTKALDGPPRLEAVKTWEVVVRPEKAGTFELPRIEYPIFDPALNAYTVLRANPLSLTVEASADYERLQAQRAAQVAASNGNPATAAPSPTEPDAKSELAFIDEAGWDASPRVGSHSRLTSRQGLVLGIAALLFGLSFVTPHAGEASSRRLAERAFRQSEQLLRTATGSTSESQRFATISTALRSYLAYRSGRAAEGIEPRGASELVAEVTGDGDLAKRLEAALEEAATASYAPVGAEQAAASTESAQSLLRELHAAWNKPRMGGRA